MKNKFAFILLFIVMLPCIFVFTGCASTKVEDSKCAMSKEYTCTYNSETDKTKIEFEMYFQNDTIFNVTQQKLTFKLYNNDSFVKNEDWFWSIKVEANQTIESYSCNFETTGEIDAMELIAYSPTLDNVWNTYKVWWLVAIIAPIIISIAYLIIILVRDLDLSDIFESVGTYISSAIILVWGIIPSFIFGDFNWFKILICFIGVVELILLCLAMSGIRAIIEYNGINPFESIKDKINERKEKRNYQKFLAPIQKCGSNKEELSKFEKDYLINYCNEMDIASSGRRKIDYIDSIALFASGDKSVIKKSNKDKTIKKDNKKNVKTSSITFNDIAGLDDAKQAFKEKVVMPFEHPELYKKFGKKSGGGILLYGLPGTGKTMFAEASSNEIDATFISIKCSDIKSKWYGESENKIKEIFNNARKSKKAIIFFDEFEAIGAKRTDNSDNGNNDLVPQILAEMQGVGTNESNSTIMVIAATNKPWAIDSAFLRPGRFDEKIYVPLPDLKARKKLFQLKLNNLPQEQLDIDYLAKSTTNYNGADITEICEKLKLKAINKSIDNGKEMPITMEDVKEVLSNIHSSVSIEDINKLKDFESNF